MVHVVYGLCENIHNTTMGGGRAYKILAIIIKQHWFVGLKAILSIYKFSYLG